MIPALIDLLQRMSQIKILRTLFLFAPKEDNISLMTGEERRGGCLSARTAKIDPNKGSK